VNFAEEVCSGRDNYQLIKNCLQIQQGHEAAVFMVLQLPI